TMGDGSDPAVKGAPGTITLDIPLTLPGDITQDQIDQITKALGDELQNAPFGLMAVQGAFTAILDATTSLSSGILDSLKSGGQAYLDQNKDQIASAFQTISDGADKASSSIYDMIQNSTYPNFTDFLKLMLAVAQDIKQLANEARQAAVE